MYSEEISTSITFVHSFHNGLLIGETDSNSRELNILYTNICAKIFHEILMNGFYLFLINFVPAQKKPTL